MTMTLAAPDSTGPLPIVFPAEAFPAWFDNHVCRVAAYGRTVLLRTWQDEATAAGDHLSAAVFAEAAALRTLYRENNARLVDLYWPAATGSPSDLHN